MRNDLQKLFKYTSIYLLASLDLVRALELAGKRVKNKKFSKVLESVQRDLQAGKPVSEAMKIFKDKKLLDSVCWSMLVSSELSGKLSKTLGEIGTYMKGQSAIRKSFLSSLAYPIGVICSSVLMVYFLMTVIFPKITPLFASLKAPMPPATRALLAFSNFLSENTAELLLMAPLSVVLLYGIYRRNISFKHFTQSVVCRMPYISRIIRLKELHRISLSCHFLMKSQKTIVEAVSICKDTSPLMVMAETIGRTVIRMNTGQNMSESSRKERLFDDEWIDMLSVGESSGSLPQTFSDLSSFYEGQLKDEFDRMARWAEPVALSGSAGIILIVALSVIQPMYSIIQFVQPN